MTSNNHTRNNTRNNTRSPKGETLHTHYAKGIYRAMRQRCNPGDKVYAGATLCKEWAKPGVGFEAFYDWVVYEAGYSDGYRLDKNVLFPGNNLYAPHTCAFTPTYMHTLFNNCDKSCTNRANNDMPLGIRLARYDRYGIPVYVAQCRTLGKQVTLGSFHEPMEAHAAWQHAKVNAILECIDLYQMEDVHSVDVVQALLGRVNQLREDITRGRETILLQ